MTQGKDSPASALVSMFWVPEVLRSIESAQCEETGRLGPQGVNRVCLMGSSE